MPVSIDHQPGSSLMIVELEGKLSDDDYERYVPHIERLLQEHGRLDLLVRMRNFSGWEPAALWEDIKFDAKHRSDVGRLAFVGDRTWEKWMTKICNPFTSAEVRYFDESESHQAEAWLHQARSQGAEGSS